MKAPVSITLMAASVGQFALKSLVRFHPGRSGEAPNWEGRGENITTHELGVPVTDRSYWEGRYALCTLMLENEAGERLEIVDAVAAVSREKRIVSTSIVGRDGTVKEYINDGDWQINIVVGVQAVENGEILDEYPSEGLKALRKFLDEKKAVKVASEFFKVFDITKMVIKSYSATQQTEANYQAVSITAVSDEDYEIYSKEY